eukprot:CAMPEP_0116018034 /NCGR_PEP_ID=MMETSP0321-20121206/8407_1 /TAXON_ID=163516 /ORGANISM="Leptocylindrus danicus var. danicus, Strain B650" /LENGTH=404 /DNA_ID=CAMNT_0003488349 /DNA_START=61 /DNA_END=1275 /DNA_ORIENTATION=+
MSLTSFSLKKDDVDIRIIYTAGAAVVIPLSAKLIRSFFKRNVHTSYQNALTGSVSILNNQDSVLQRDGVNASIDGYEKLFDGARKEDGAITTDESIKTREKEYKTMVDSFYNLVTDFYEWGWGQSFHFAPRYVGETFFESIKRAEYFLAASAGFGKGDKVLDVGCGVGGPLRNIAQFTYASITGVTINEYQVKVGNKYCEQKGLSDTCQLVQGDFQKLKEKFEPETFDYAYAIEATCHSPNRVDCFSGVAHCLKKGGVFVGYEWIVLPERGYDKDNEDHVRVKEGIEVGNGLPTLATAADVVKALEDSGFEVVESYDANRNVHSEFEIPWYQTLKGTYDMNGFRMTRLGRICTHIMVTTLEFLRIAPKGTVKVSALLNATALDLVEGGENEIFTPSFYFKAIKK